MRRSRLHDCDLHTNEHHEHSESTLAFEISVGGSSNLSIDGRGGSDAARSILNPSPLSSPVLHRLPSGRKTHSRDIKSASLVGDNTPSSSPSRRRKFTRAGAQTSTSILRDGRRSSSPVMPSDLRSCSDSPEAMRDYNDSPGALLTDLQGFTSSAASLPDSLCEPVPETVAALLNSPTATSQAMVEVFQASTPAIYATTKHANGKPRACERESERASQRWKEPAIDRERQRENEEASHAGACACRAHTDVQEILAQFDAARQRMQEESVGALGTDITRSQSRARQVSFRRTSIIVCKLQYSNELSEDEHHCMQITVYILKCPHPVPVPVPVCLLSTDKN